MNASTNPAAPPGNAGGVRARNLHLPVLAAAWCSAYAVIHAWWAVAGDPALLTGGSPSDCRTMCGESPLPGGWLPVALAAAAAIGCLLLTPMRSKALGPQGRWLLIGLSGLGGAGMIAYCMLFWIGLTMMLLIPFGQPFGSADWGLLLVRGSGVAGGSMAVAVALSKLRTLRPTCDRCGGVHGRSEGRIAPSPWWGFVGAYAAVAGMLVRMLPHASSVLEDFARENSGFKLFVVLMILAGSVLPLALVHRWGRIWPRWVVPVAGRDVPRWLVLGPGIFIGAGFTAYFGVGGYGAMLTGVQPADLPATTMIGGYTAWGLGLLVATAAYARSTGKPCPDLAATARSPVKDGTN